MFKNKQKKTSTEYYIIDQTAFKGSHKRYVLFKVLENNPRYIKVQYIYIYYNNKIEHDSTIDLIPNTILEKDKVYGPTNSLYDAVEQLDIITDMNKYNL